MKVATQKTFSSSSQLKHQLAKAEKLKVIFLSYKSQVAPGVVSETLASSVRGKCAFVEWVLAVTQWHSQRRCCTKYLPAIVLVSSRLTDQPLGLLQWGFTSQFTVTASSHIQTTFGSLPTPFFFHFQQLTFVLMPGGCQMVTDRCDWGLNKFMFSKCFHVEF